MMWSLALRGNFFGQIVERDRLGYPTQIMPVNPDLVKPHQDPSGVIEWRFAGKVVPTEDVFHIRYQYMPGMLLGLNPIQVCKYSFGLGHVLDVHAETTFRNSANPLGVLEAKGTPSQNAVEQMIQRWHSMHQGVRQSSLPAILTEETKFNPISISPEDQQLLESRKYSAEEICGIVFQVPPFMLGMTQRSTCLAAGTPVLTDKGPRAIETIKAGERVWSLDESQARFVLSKVVAQEKTGCDPILTIKTRPGRTLRANAKHKVLVRRKFANPQRGVGKYRCVEWRNIWTTAGELKVGDYLIAGHGLPASDKRTAPNGRELTPQFMEFAGLLIGDGNVIKGNKGVPAVVTIARHRDARYMDVYRRGAEREFNATHGVGTATERKLSPIRLREYERCTTFSSVTAASELASLGFSGTAHTKRVPEWLFGVAPELQLAFLRGYADADGSVTERGELIFCSCNPELLQDVRHLCIQLGIPVGHLCEHDTAGTGMVMGRKVTRGKMYRLNCCDADSNLRIGTHDSQDLKRLQRAKRSPRRQWWDADYQGRGGSPEARPGTYFDIEGARLQCITSIEKSAPEPVYDLTVEGTHTFLADGLVVHNSYGRGIEQQERTFIANTLSGYLCRVERALTECLPDGEYVNFDIRHRVRGTAVERAQQASLLMLCGAWCADDSRALFDMPPLPNGEGKIFNTPLNTELLEKALLEVKQMEKEEDEPEAPPQNPQFMPVPGGGRGPKAPAVPRS